MAEKQDENAQLNKSLGLALQGQGMLDMALEKFQHLHGNFGIDQIVGQAHGSAQDNQYGSYQDHAFFHNFRQLPPVDIPVDENFYN